MTTMVLSPTPYMGLQYLGAAAAGCLMFLYQAGTTTKQSGFTDNTGDTALPNPIVLNANGDVAPSALGTACGLWIDPTLVYKVVFAPPTAGDPPTSTIWTLDQVTSPESAVLAQLAAYEAQLAGVPIGTVLPYCGTDATLPAGWYYAIGQIESRSTFSALFAVIGTAFGSGDGMTTFGWPDMRGRYPMGADNMGGTAVNRVTAISGVPSTTLGGVGGSQLAQADTLTAIVTPTIYVTDPTHTHQQASGSGVQFGGSTGVAGNSVGSGAPAATGITVTALAAATVSSALTGASQNMPPLQVTNYIIYAGA